MRVVFDPADGRDPGAAADNLRVARGAAATLALLLGESVQIGLTRRDAQALSYAKRLAILAGYDLAVRVERGDLSVQFSTSAGDGARSLARVIASAVRRETGQQCPVYRVGYRKLLREAPMVVVYLGPGIPREPNILAAAVAAHLAAALPSWAAVG